MQTGEELAVKIIEWKKQGIPCLMELSMMATLAKMPHPCLCFAKAIEVTPSSAYIIQDRAEMDLNRWRLKRGPGPLHEELARRVMHSVTAGLEFLHNNGIIHGDVKLENVLVFPNQIYKLGDFSLSLMDRWRPGEDPYLTVCTVSHRPAEVWCQMSYGLSTDIWALGCTFFELIHGKMLFPYQARRIRENIPSMKPPQIREASMKMSLNAICDWRDYIRRGHPAREKKEGRLSKMLVRSKTEYLGPKIPNIARSHMTELMLDMLSVDPENRPTADKILSHKFFEGTNRTPNEKMQLLVPDKARNRSTDISDKCNWAETNPRIWKEACLLAFRYSSNVMKKDIGDNNIFSATCLHMAHKVVTRHNVSDPKLLPGAYSVEAYEILLKEREICSALEYRVHATV